MTFFHLLSLIMFYTLLNPPLKELLYYISFKNSAPLLQAPVQSTTQYHFYISKKP